MSDWVRAGPALAVACACGLPARAEGQPWVPSPAPQGKRAAHAGAPPCETLFVLIVREALRRGVSGARDLILIIASAPLKAWRRADPDAQVGHAPAHHPRAVPRGYRVHTLRCSVVGPACPCSSAWRPPRPRPLTHPVRRRCSP
jgi:hypothetical protein